MRWMALGLAMLAGAADVAMPVGVARAARPVESWGKPGVGFDQYRDDAIGCARHGYLRDVSQDEPAKRFLRGWRSADDGLNQIDHAGPNFDAWFDAVRRTGPAQRLREVQAIQVGDVEQCLTAKGYSRFTLTRGEAKTLARYPTGSEARRQYLHSLAAAAR